MKRWFFRLASVLAYDCRRASDDGTSLDEGALGWWDRVRIRLHLSICPGCKAYRCQMLAVTRAAKAPEPAALPPAEKDRLVELFRARRGGGS